MEPQTKEQLKRKEDLHKEIVLSLEVIGLTNTKYKPSTIRIITQFRNSIPKVKAILKNRKLQKERKDDPTTWWEVLTAVNWGFLFGMFVFFVGRCFSESFKKCF